MKRSALVKWMVLLKMCCFGGTALAQLNPSGTPGERALISPMCQAKLKDDNRSPEATAVIAQLGWDNWIPFNHYCYGQIFVLRARKATSKKDRDMNLGWAVPEYKYTLRGAKPDFWMRPQMLVELGRIHQQLGQSPSAVVVFQEALAANPAYEPAYLALVGELRRGGSTREALDLATNGLRRLPKSEALQKAYLELGGKKPFPEPLSAVHPSQPAETPGGGPAVAQDARVEGVLPAPAVEGAEPEKRGCRFCPPEEIKRRWSGDFGKTEVSPSK